MCTKRPLDHQILTHKTVLNIMKKLSITKAGFTAFTNAMHTELHTKILAYIDDYGEGKLGLDKSVVEEYRASIAKEQDYVNHSYASSLTPDIVKARGLRDSWYTYVRTTMVAAQYSPQSTFTAAFSVLNIKLLKVYPSISEMTDGQAATVQIRGFVQTAKEECSAQLAVLNLSDALERLETCNEDFAVKYKRRNTERAEAVPSEMKNARIETDQLYRKLSYVLQGNALRTSSEEATQEVYDKCAVAVGNIGVLLGDWQYRLRVSRAGAVVAPTEGSDEDLAGDSGNTVGDSGLSESEGDAEV
jgi:hypothetical protein